MLYIRIENWLPSTKNKRNLEFITANSHFSKFMNKYHLFWSLGRVRDDANPYCVCTRCYTELGPLYTVSYLNRINNPIRQVYLHLLYKWEVETEINNPACGFWANNY